jgi:ubiquinone/menaquinone biosynthesis C-methylase UbiE
MANQRVCPWWLGYLLVTPLRRFLHDPEKLLGDYVGEGMTVVEPGPGMGFFTAELARRVGPSGRVVAVDIQPKMLDALRRRLAKRGLLHRVDVRLAQPDSLGLSDLNGRVDFVLAFAVVHELPSSASFFAEAFHIMKPGASLLLVEPKGHVSPTDFQVELTEAAHAGFNQTEGPAIWRSHTALLKTEFPALVGGERGHFG